ncbi:hypothetical protein WR25_16843 [Diploscapter pachys]|uniref:Uncharacterized protein n=1 Tax=Diploscapter pachys TaxID=2018661 RepID=A0A2A2LDJ1_9BILA|nr:hypothetical protein WR25_16843 [Diploscapter pachys]
MSKFLRRFVVAPTKFASRHFTDSRNTSAFGIVLDIDGVLQRGRILLPRVKEAFRLVTDERGSFEIPTVFLTNGTNCLRAEKAAKLSNLLGLHVRPEQVIMAHSPLRMFSDLHNKNALVIGQSNSKTIATNCGFKNIITIENLREMFPHLDCVDFSRKLRDPRETAKLRKNFKPIEAIIMLGEPLIWESALQLILDCLLTGGTMDEFTRGISTYPQQIPVVACNVDLVWMAEQGSPLPRIGHGVFIHLIESLYEKLSGRRLKYEAVLGKPTEISYLHAAHMIQRQALSMGLSDVKTLYVIGDNPMSDVLGAKLFDRYLRHGGRGRFDHLDLDLFEESDVPKVRTRHVCERCISVLVETGVYTEGCRLNGVVQPISMLYESLTPGEQEGLQQSDFVEHDLYAAIRQILSRERFRAPSPPIYHSSPMMASSIITPAVM